MPSRIVLTLTPAPGGTIPIFWADAFLSFQQIKGLVVDGEVAAITAEALDVKI
jgi:hypothetical protein